MLKSALVVLLGAALLPVAAIAQTWKDVPVIDQACSTKFTPKTVNSHTRSCILSCAAGGSPVGILTSNGKFLKFDKAGNQKAVAELKASQKTDDVRATVTGKQEGNTIAVRSIKLD